MLDGTWGVWFQHGLWPKKRPVWSRKKLDDVVKNQNFFKASFRRGLCRTRSGSRNPLILAYSECRIRHPGPGSSPGWRIRDRHDKFGIFCETNKVFQWRVSYKLTMTKKRISNPEYRMSKEGILSIIINTIDRAQRFNPSKFVIRYSAVLQFAVQPNRRFAKTAILVTTIYFSVM
jgi:hypothetical protein